MSDLFAFGNLLLGCFSGEKQLLLSAKASSKLLNQFVCDDLLHHIHLVRNKSFRGKIKAINN